MGVTGLWRLIEPAGKPVPVETLENKVLAVDISIWLHQMVKGYQDAKGAPLPNAHLMGLFQRLCKLLYFRIKPVFVFDGAFPQLKKETIAKRQDHKAKYNSESERIKRELALLLSKKTAVNSLLGKQISPKKGNTLPQNNDDLFKLTALPEREGSESESEDEQNSSGSIIDLHSVDIESEGFKKLEVKEKYDLLVELKETRKMNSWGRLHELPKKSDSFSDFQMQRLLKRRKVQECLQETEKEMGDSGMSLNDLESLLNEEGIDTKIDTLPTRRIASNVSTRFLLIKDMKQAIADAKKRDQIEEQPSTSHSSKDENNIETESKPEKIDELEDDLQKAIKMSMECVDEVNTSNVSKTDESWTSCLTDTDYSDDSEEDDGFEQTDNMSTAKAYIMQYSDFTHSIIDKLIINKNKGKSKPQIANVDEILEEINKEKSIIVDNVDISSDEEVTKPSSGSEENAIESNSELGENVEADFTQTSVVCIDPKPLVINLDSSMDEAIFDNKSGKEVIIKQEDISSEDEFEEVSSTAVKQVSDSSDSDFEEVSDIEMPKVNNPVVELTLNVGNAPEDDIFADIFEGAGTPIPKQEMIKDIVTVCDKPSVKIDISTEAVTTAKAPSPIMNKSLEDNNRVIEKSDKISEHSEKIVQDEGNEVSHEVILSKPNQEQNDNVIEALNLPLSETASDNNSEDPDNGSDNNNVDIVKTPDASIQPPKEVLTTEKLNTMVEEIQNQERDLEQEKGRLDRVGRNITEQMTKEAQELLQIFGIPYIVAPMEAEAQCAFLENVNLTDGTITDDSDIWLFGGRTVYKNFFNQKKHVLQFLAERIETSFNLSREQLVLLALLVGSDYTTGLTGVGPVTALEILASFPFNKKQFLNETSKPARYAQIVKGLQEFKQWVRAGKRTDNISLKKKLKNVKVSEDFPSVRVVQAYLEPNIEKSEDKFTWGELDITVLRDYTRAKFGWSQNKLDEIIKPVLKRIQDRKTQRTMQDFFKRKIAFQSLEEQMSKRVKAAVQRMDPENPYLAELVEPTEDIGKTTTKRKASKAPNSKAKGKAGLSAAKQKKTEENVLKNQGVRVVSEVKDGKSEIDIKISKTDRYQEIIPQRQKDQKSLLENKLKAIEVFRKTKIDQKRKTFKRKVLQPKEKADLSESDSD